MGELIFNAILAAVAVVLFALTYSSLPAFLINPAVQACIPEL